MPKTSFCLLSEAALQIPDFHVVTHAWTHTIRLRGIQTETYTVTNRQTDQSNRSEWT